MREDTSKLNAIITDMQTRGINVEAPNVYDRYIAKFPDEMAERLTAKTMSESFKGEFSKFQKWTMKILSRKVFKKRSELNDPREDFDVANVDQLEGTEEQSGAQEKKGNSRKERKDKCTFRYCGSQKSWNSPKSRQLKSFHL
ncbi:hypothetical protein B9Z55_012323 [Caenorhabditis nigoni]|uniref:Uncharacterized protein n=1 Tax=Caenorhabditis nigoni TaxID=1611254 RepID=A0A2G5TWU2_9PELO|nr:hypothetical protein B9Z55_012323 [Caenorhabditis nigoni]